MSKTPFISLEKAKEIIKDYPTPFHIYDEKGIRENVKALKDAFSLIVSVTPFILPNIDLAIASTSDGVIIPISNSLATTEQTPHIALSPIDKSSSEAVLADPPFQMDSALLYP